MKTIDYFRLAKSLPTYLVLPLTGNSCEDFNPNSFIGAFFHFEFKNIIIVRVVYMEEFYKTLNNYQHTVDGFGFTDLVFSIPEKYLEDVKHIRKGEYSKLSDDAKDIILKLSSLKYQEKQGNFLITHPLIMAIADPEVYKEHLISLLYPAEESYQSKKDLQGRALIEEAVELWNKPNIQDYLLLPTMV